MASTNVYAKIILGNRKYRYQPDERKTFAGLNCDYVLGLMM